MALNHAMAGMNKNPDVVNQVPILPVPDALLPQIAYPEKFANFVRRNPEQIMFSIMKELALRVVLGVVGQRALLRIDAAMAIKKAMRVAMMAK